MASDRNDFARWLDRTMASEGLTGKALAQRSGLDEAQISRWRRGSGRPSLESCERLADALGVDPRRLAVTAGLLSHRIADVPRLPIPPATAMLERVRHKLEGLPEMNDRAVEEMLRVYRKTVAEEE